MGEILEIQLDNHPSIGNSWHFNSFSQKEVFSLNSSADGSEKKSLKQPLIGAPRTFVWHFNPTSVGTTAIYFNQTDRNGNQSDSIGFNITVTPTKPDLE